MSQEDIVVRCQATTQSGRQCRNYAQEGSVFCHVHKDLATETAVAEETLSPEEAKRMKALVAELDELVTELKGSVPAESRGAYSPLGLLAMLRSNLNQFTPEVRLGILESFEGMTVEDMKDIETWKGMAYMFSYSARFQAGQLKDRVNENLPEQLRSDNVIQMMRQNWEKLAPDMAKDIVANFEGATKEDFLDPDTWKGVWTMLNYSMRFQAEQLKQKLLNEEDAAE